MRGGCIRRLKERISKTIHSRQKPSYGNQWRVEAQKALFGIRTQAKTGMYVSEINMELAVWFLAVSALIGACGKQLPRK